MDREEPIDFLAKAKADIRIMAQAVHNAWEHIEKLDPNSMNATKAIRVLAAGCVFELNRFETMQNQPVNQFLTAFISELEHMKKIAAARAQIIADRETRKTAGN